MNGLIFLRVNAQQNAMPKSKVKKKKKKKPAKSENSNDLIPRTVEEWVINIPTMLDARVAITMMDKVDLQIDRYIDT